jgi:hypothetical protein
VCELIVDAILCLTRSYDRLHVLCDFMYNSFSDFVWNLVSATATADTNSQIKITSTKKVKK